MALRFNIYSREPKESEINKYILMNAKGGIIYAYLKVVYEEIIQNDIMDYDIKAKRLPYRKKSFNYNKNGNKLTSRSLSIPEYKFPLNKESDQIDKRLNRIYNDLNDAKERVFVPIGICIQTYKPADDQYIALLESLTTILRNPENETIQNSIKSLAAFCSYLLTVTHIIIPPRTNLLVSISVEQLYFNEGLINDLPYGDDVSIVYLFSILSIEHIIKLWTSILLETNIIIYTSNLNIYFHIIKALLKLIFPFKWKFMLGIIPKLILLTTNAPYLYCVLKSMFKDQEEIVNVISEIPYIKIGRASCRERVSSPV